MKVMLVDDSRAVALVMKARLESFGHDVVHALDGPAALELFCTWPPDLILMDIEMPGMNGFETTTHIRALEGKEAWAWTPIIFLTASDTLENLVTAIEAGGDDFLAKSAPEEALRSKMKAMSRIAALRERLSVANSQLEAQASRDGLTGLCNRRYMDLRVDNAWDRAIQNRHSFGLLMIDVDHFKKFNDHYGHLAGDDCLRAVAAAIEGTVAPNANRTPGGAFAARYGGEEFAVVIPGATDQSIRVMGLAITEAVRKMTIPHRESPDWGVVTVSIGGAHAPEASGVVRSVFREADAALYRAKASGRNRLMIND